MLLARNPSLRLRAQMGKPYVSVRVLLLIFCCTQMPVSAQSPPVDAPAPPSPSSPAPMRREFKWDVEYIMRAPDCKQSVMIGINGEFPGPTISANAGERIRVEVTNRLHTEGLVIHWHGIKQIGTPWADGTASISQCPINPDQVAEFREASLHHIATSSQTDLDTGHSRNKWCANPGENFTYEFLADKPGTFFYHGHFGMQRAAGLYGSLIVNGREQPEPFKYDGELPMMLLSDWYHENVYAQAAGLDGKGKHWQWVGEPQSLLINGRGQFECSLGKTKKGKEICDRTKEDRLCKEGEDKTEACELIRRSECGPFCEDSQCSPVVLDVDPGKTYRLRIASTTSLSALNVQVQGHKLKVVEADGNFVEPFDVDDIDIYSGESYSVLLTTKKDTDQPASSYWISVGVRGRRSNTPPALAILNYTNSKFEWPASAPPETPAWDDVERSKKFTYGIKALDGTPAPPSVAYRRITMLNTQDMVKEQVKWAINNFIRSLPATPYLSAYFYGIEKIAFDSSDEPPETYRSGYDIKKPPGAQAQAASISTTTVSDRVFKIAHHHVVLQNANMLQEGVSESHPWHLHGHDFWVLGYGDGEYNHAEHSKDLNTKNPPLRNTVVLFPGGWTALRFKANNPGVWAFHCHIEPHLHLGMGVIFAVGTEELPKLNVPREAIMCGKAKTAVLPLAPPVAQSPPP